jgi:anaerobic selenocysteine-containing dehydrogenase
VTTPTERRTALRTCPLCEATCGLELTLEGDRVVSVRGDRDDVFSGGYLCPKGALFGELEHDPDRLDGPRIRRDGRLLPATWDEADAEVASRLRAIVAEHGPDAVAIYLGNPNVHTLAGQLYARPLVKALRTRNVFTASSVDQLPKHVACGMMFGDPLAIPVPDIDRTDLLVVLGANPRVSNGSLMTAPDLPGRLTALQRRGGRLVVVDPRRTRTADRADQHLAIRPGTDALLLAAIVTTVEAEGLLRIPDHLHGHVTGVEAVVAALSPFTPESVAAACDIEADVIRELARDLATSERACVYGRLGTTTTRFGTLTSWLVDVVNLVTGNLDVPGGAMFPLPAHHRPTRRPFRMGRWHSRVAGLPEAMGELPVATLADEIETPGEGQIRALICVAGNPFLSTPDSDRLDAAIAGLDLVVSVDPYVTATTRHSDVLLPPPSALHHSHLDLAFAGLSVRNVVHYSPAVLPVLDDQRDEWEILLVLAATALGAELPVDVDGADRFVAQQLAESLVSDPAARTGDKDPDALLAATSELRGPERLLDMLLRAGPYGDGFGSHLGGLTLAEVQAHPHGLDLGALEPQIPAVLRTASGKVETAPEELLADVTRLRAELPAIAAGSNGGLVLVGRRHLRTNNSWSHNVPGLIKDQELCTLLINPADASARGLADGDLAAVRSTAGALIVPVEVSDELRPGVVSLPHGFGHDRDGVELTVARKVGGVTSNVLTDRTTLDPVSGTAVLNGIPVDVVRSDI